MVVTRNNDQELKRYYTHNQQFSKPISKTVPSHKKRCKMEQFTHLEDILATYGPAIRRLLMNLNMPDPDPRDTQPLYDAIRAIESALDNRRLPAEQIATALEVLRLYRVAVKLVTQNRNI